MSLTSSQIVKVMMVFDAKLKKYLQYLFNIIMSDKAKHEILIRTM